MKKITMHYKKMKITYIAVALCAIIINLFLLPNYQKFESTGDNLFTVFLDGTSVGTVTNTDEIDALLIKARTEIASQSKELVYTDAEVTTKGQEVLIGKVDSEKTVKDNMVKILKKNIKQTLQHAYTLKINEFTVNLSSCDDVKTLLQASIDKYDTAHEYSVDLVLDPTRELNVLTTQINYRKDSNSDETPVFQEAGISKYFTEVFEAIEPAGEKDFDDYNYGLQNLSFADTIEVVDAYLMKEELTALSSAIEEVTKEQEKNKIYEVVAGDTLSQIAENNNLTIEKLIEMNATIENENSTIRIGDEIIVTVPEPELSVERQELQYYEEDYDADVQYVDNDDWYTTDQVTIQEPSAGHRKVAAIISYRNNAEVLRELQKEEIVMEAVPKIIERGTKIPPSYIKPISGGRLSSGFGGRSAPTKGASTYHQGVDWSTPVGTAVMASSSGTVTKAGWGSGYGYVIYIQHADGRETRYGHLSKVLVSAGQQVVQGQKIALSGNTGRSTGPHVHFEIRINGSAVNPLKYLN